MNNKFKKEEKPPDEQSGSASDKPDANPPDEKKPDYKPWELDLKGHPLSERKREITSYEIWMDKQREEKGLDYKCPNCGEDNRILVNMTEQKCIKCGFEFSDYESIADEMGISDESKVPPSVSRLPSGLGDVRKMVGKELAIPEFLQQEPIPQFMLIFKNSSFFVLFVFLIVYLVSLIIAIPLIASSSDFFLKWIASAFLVITGISVFLGFGRASRVTSIRVSDDSVIFSGMGNLVQMSYDEITSISNQRELNNAIRIRGVIQSNTLYIIVIYLVAFVILADPRYILLYLSPVPGLVRFVFCLFVAIFLYTIYRAFHDTLDTATADSSASSMFYNNHISISTKHKGIEYSFIGSGNLQFRQALAIIIYMTKRKNKGCRIDGASFQAAEKGQEHYKSWIKKFNRF